MTQLSITPEGIIIVTLQGELGNHEANRIRTQISTEIFGGTAHAIIWDLTNLSFMDSSGIGLVLGRMRDLSPQRGETLILNPSPTMEKIFQFSGLGSVVRRGTIENAIGEIGGVYHEQ